MIRRRILLCLLVLTLLAGCRKASEADAPQPQDPTQAARQVKDAATPAERPGTDPVKVVPEQPKRPVQEPPPELPGRPPAAAGGFLNEFASPRLDDDGAMFESRLPYWLKDDRAFLLGAVEYPEQPLAPAFFVLVRLPAQEDDYSVGGSASVSPPDQADAWNVLHVSTGGGPVIRYRVLKETAREVFLIGGERFALANGRVFVVDQTVKPSAVLQLKADLADLFGAAPFRQPTRDAFAAALEKLRLDQEPVRKLFPDSEKK